jgi:Tol biopolymer transport system component/DNA-binding winged helix-turn-helix (wHTH) protein
MKLAERIPPFAIEDWIVDPGFHQLSRGSSICTLEPRVMSVLLQLAAHPQRVISKDEFLRAVWPDTFVGEDALTRCISILRHALNDDPHNPRFIKTVSKVGYCLLISTRALETENTSVEQVAPDVHSMPEASRRFPRSILGATAAVLFLAVITITTAILVTRRRHADPISSVIPTFQLTTDAGEQSRPALSPDGKRLAFVWAKEDGSRQHVYVKQLGSESVLRLTNLPDNEYSPVWSPDGRSIAFLSSSTAGLALYVASLDPTHSPDKLYIPGETTRWEQGGLAWSPDGRSLVLADHLGAEPSSSIYRIDVDTRRAHALTSPPSGWEGDLSPVFSPDGQKIAFLRASENSVLDVYWIPAAGGQPHQVTHDGKMIDGIAWSSDSRSIIFSSNRAGEYGLYKIPLVGGTPERMPVGTEGATQPAIPRDGKNLAFVQSSAIFGILEVSAARDETSAVKDSMIVSSTAQDSAPSISPDGSQLAFQSWRSGTQQIWLSSINGQTLRQLTPAAGDLSGSGSPSWSPSGRDLLFDSRIRGHSHIYIIPAAGGTPTEITFADANDIVPRWSVDGRTIYFRSNRGGRWQLWKVPGAGGEPQPISRDDGMVGQESPDGKWLYFARGGENGIWRMPTSGGEEVRILDQPLAGYWAYWAVGRAGIYFLDQTQATPAISIYDPSTQKASTFAKLIRVPPPNAGIALLGGGRTVLISDKHDAGSHISIAQGVF